MAGAEPAGGQEEEKLNAVHYACVSAMAVSVCSHKLLVVSIGSEHARMVQAFIVLVGIVVYMAAFDEKGVSRVKRVGVVGCGARGNELAAAVGEDRRLGLVWLWDAAEERHERDSEGELDAVAIVEEEFLDETMYEHGLRLLGKADLVIANASSFCNGELRARLCAAATAAGRRIIVARQGSWGAELQQLLSDTQLSSVQVAFTQAEGEVEKRLGKGADFAPLRTKLSARRGGGAVLLYDGAADVALWSRWAAAVDPRAAHLLGCAALACGAEECPVTLRWEVTPSAAAVQRTSKGNDKETRDREEKVAVIATTSDGAEHRFSVSLAGSGVASCGAMVDALASAGKRAEGRASSVSIQLC